MHVALMMMILSSARLKEKEKCGFLGFVAKLLDLSMLLFGGGFFFGDCLFLAGSIVS